MEIGTFIRRGLDRVMGREVAQQSEGSDAPGAQRCEYGHPVFSGNNLCSYGHHAAVKR